MMNINALTIPVKRELWEYRGSFVVLPVVLAGLLLIVMAAGLVISTSGSIEITIDGENINIIEPQGVDKEEILGEKEDGLQITIDDDDDDDDDITDEDLQEFKKVLQEIEEGFQSTSHEDITRGALTGLNLLFSGVALMVVLYYLLAALYTDRKDRSVLFWKSMPVSETQTVLTKLCVALFAVPAIATLVALVVGFVYMVAAMIFVSSVGHSSAASVWTSASVIGITVTHLMMVFAAGLWVAPLYGWLLLSSAAARRTPFLMAVLVPAAMMLAESWVLGSHGFAGMLLSRLPGVVMDGGELNFLFSQQLDSQTVAGFITAPGLWGGLMVTGLFVTAAVWLRNNRYEI